MKIIEKQRGVILAEIIISLMIMIVVATAGIGAHLFLKQLIARLEKKVIAMHLANSEMEELRYKWLSGDYTGQPFSGGNHSTHTIMSGDIPTGFNISYFVENRVDTDWDEDGDNTDSDYKIIAVKCTYSADKEIKISGFFVE